MPCTISLLLSAHLRLALGRITQRRSPQLCLPFKPLLVLFLALLSLFLLRILPRSLCLTSLLHQLQPRQVRSCLIRLALRVQLLVPLASLLCLQGLTLPTGEGF